jgi:hypothetical protein
VRRANGCVIVVELLGEYRSPSTQGAASKSSNLQADPDAMAVRR